MLIVVSGLPGSGKSTLADGLANALRAPVLSVDPIESAMIRAGVPRSFETGLAAYLVAEACAESFLRAGLDVVIDAVSGVEPARDQSSLPAHRAPAPRSVSSSACSDSSAAARRLAERDRGLAMGEPVPATSRRAASNGRRGRTRTSLSTPPRTRSGTLRVSSPGSRAADRRVPSRLNGRRPDRRLSTRPAWSARGSLSGSCCTRRGRRSRPAPRTTPGPASC